MTQEDARDSCLLRLDLQALTVRRFSRGGLINPNIDSIDTSAGIGIIYIKQVSIKKKKLKINEKL